MLVIKESMEELNKIILTKKEIFRTAHRYAKKMEGDYKACFAYALKYTYACLKACKEKVALKGSPKQVSWATEIRNNISYRNIMLRVDRPSTSWNEEYTDIVKKLEFIKILNSIENAGVIICLAYQAIDSWYASIRRYRNGKNKVIEIGKQFNPNYFVIVDGKFLQCEWGGTLYKKQYFNY